MGYTSLTAEEQTSTATSTATTTVEEDDQDLIGNSAVLDEIENQGSFSDVDANAWYAGYVDDAVQAGLVTGYHDGTFQPGAQVTQRECILMVYRALGIQPKWDDVMIAADYVGATVSDDGDRAVTRGEAAFIICTLARQPAWTGDHQFKDTEGHQYGDELETLGRIGIFEGDDVAPPERASVRPDGSLNRAEAAKLALVTKQAADEVDASGSLLPIELAFQRYLSAGYDTLEAYRYSLSDHPDDFKTLLAEEWVGKREEWRIFTGAVKDLLDYSQVPALEVFSKPLSIALKVEEILWDASNGDVNGVFFDVVDLVIDESLDLITDQFEPVWDNRVSDTLFNSNNTISDTGIRLFFEKMRFDFLDGMLGEIEDWFVDYMEAASRS